MKLRQFFTLDAGTIQQAIDSERRVVARFHWGAEVSGPIVEVERNEVGPLKARVAGDPQWHNVVACYEVVDTEED